MRPDPVQAESRQQRLGPTHLFVAWVSNPRVKEADEEEELIVETATPGTG